ncbi:hypothetical protein [Nannocystis bainbridge]|uniref:Uncharacterized protein n=1 Tax=Nannocystis bainbridge TaxID=2995303 RepID=A0ABT5E5C3_9BACT|nr:hypothetical protein [Nannocystis bainbridge]MDC0721060.1 hypothetical protein [Nannocystis bainbridge]
MQRSFLVKTPVILLFAAVLAPLACGADKGSGTETSGVTTDSTQATQATQATQTMGTSSDDSVSTTGTFTTTGTVTSEPPATTTTTAPTTEATTTGGAGQFCQEACASDTDCFVFGEDAGYTCQDQRCVNDVVTVCSTDEQCDVILSGWTITCAAQADCGNSYACVAIGDGAGKCAPRPSDGAPCDVLVGEELQVEPIEGGAPVTVCGLTETRCDDGVCFDPCANGSDCATQTGHPVCNPRTQRCECGEDSDCATSGIGGYAVCIAGVCGCGQDADCVDTLRADTCVEGICHCSSAAACKGPQVFDGTTKVCAGA